MAPPPSTVTVNCSMEQSVAFTSPPPPPSPAPAAPNLPPAVPAKPQVCVVGPGMGPESLPHPADGAVQQRLEQTNSSLEAALKAVERKLILEDNSDGGANTVKSAGTILDDIGNMFDDLADQLDAMLD